RDLQHLIGDFEGKDLLFSLFKSYSLHGTILSFASGASSPECSKKRPLPAPQPMIRCVPSKVNWNRPISAGTYDKQRLICVGKSRPVLTKASHKSGRARSGFGWFPAAARNSE